MKKLLAVLTISLGFVGSANATDLIALATNGKSNENSLGVKTLNNQEMSEVVGGLQYYTRFYVQNSAIYTNYYIVNPSDLAPYSVNSFYQELSRILEPNEILGYAQRFRVGSREFTWLVGINTQTKSIREIPFGSSTKLFQVIDDRYNKKYY